MGLDSTFFEAKQKLPFNKLNKHCIDPSCDWDSKYIDENLKEIYYFRKFHDLHTLIINQWRKENPNENCSENGLFVELTPTILKEILDFYTEEDDFYPILCKMYVNTTFYKKIYYYEGDF